MTDNLEPGWYWVKWRKDNIRWSPALWSNKDWWTESVLNWTQVDGDPAIIGPRLTPPEGE